MKLVIVGGVAGGASAAARRGGFRKTRKSCCSSAAPMFRSPIAACRTTSAAKSRNAKSCSIVTPERLRTRFNLDVRTRSSVESIDRGAKRVRSPQSGHRRGIRRDVRQIDSRARRRADPSAAAWHRSAGHLHAAKPGRHGSHHRTLQQGVKRSGRDRRRLHRPGTGRKPGSPRTFTRRSSNCRIRSCRRSTRR